MAKAISVERTSYYRTPTVQKMRDKEALEQLHAAHAPPSTASNACGLYSSGVATKHLSTVDSGMMVIIYLGGFYEDFGYCWGARY
jgi:hypothetical protein